jgi:glutamyl-tRNA reductase
LRRERAQDVVAARGGKPIVVLDLGMPHNVDPTAGDVPGIDVFDLGRLHRDGYTSAKGWEAELERVRTIVLAEAVACVTRLRSRAADDFGAKIQAMAAEVAAAEAERVFRKLPDLDPDSRDAVLVAVSRAVRKLLHAPTVRGREAAARGDDDTLAVARWLFALEDHNGGIPTGRRGAEVSG